MRLFYKQLKKSEDAEVREDLVFCENETILLEALQEAEKDNTILEGYLILNW